MAMAMTKSGQPKPLHILTGLCLGMGSWDVQNFVNDGINYQPQQALGRISSINSIRNTDQLIDGCVIWQRQATSKVSPMGCTPSFLKSSCVFESPMESNELGKWDNETVVPVPVNKSEWFLHVVLSVLYRTPWPMAITKVLNLLIFDSWSLKCKLPTAPHSIYMRFYPFL